MKRALLITASPLFFALAACGGGSLGTSVVSSTPTPPPLPTPSPTPTPTPTPTATVEPVTFSTLSGDTTLAVTSAPQSPALSMRYDAASGQYLVSVPSIGTVNSPIMDDPYNDTDSTSGYQRVTAAGTDIYFKTNSATATQADHRFLYSAMLGAFNYTDGGYGDDVYAVGFATPVSNLPVTGSATFSGLAKGTSTVTEYNDWCPVAAPVSGTVDIKVDFATGKLTGVLATTLGFYASDTGKALPPLDFTAALASGSNGYTGSFATSLSGSNSIHGLFTGPAAEETIGSFAFPFAVPSGYPQTEGSTATAYGSFIAKR